MAAQLMATKGLRLRDESRCSASATSSLPDPVGPSISTGVMRGATRRTRRLTSSMHAALPISSGSRSRRSACAPRRSRMQIGWNGCRRASPQGRGIASDCGRSTSGCSAVHREASILRLCSRLRQLRPRIASAFHRGAAIPRRRVGLLAPAQRVEQFLPIGPAGLSGARRSPAAVTISTPGNRL